jgi:WD40 repeat protein
VVLQRDEEEWPVDRNADQPLTLPAGDYQVRLAIARGGLRPWPGSFTVTAGKGLTVPLQLAGEEARYAGSPGPVYAAALSSRGLLNLSGGGGDLRIALWDPARVPKPERFLEGHEADVRCLALSPDGKRAVSGEGGKQKQQEYAVWLWDLTTATGRIVARNDHWVTALAWLPDGKQVLFGDYEGHLVLLDLETKRQTPLAGHTGRIQGVSVSADGARAVSVGADKRFILWDLKEHRALHEPWLLEEGAGGVALTADGQTAVTARRDGAILVWDLRKGTAAKLASLKGAVNSVAVSADGSRLVSGGDDRTVRLWDLASGQEIYRGQHDDKNGKVQAVALSADGKHALSAGLDRTVRLWRLPASLSR